MANELPNATVLMGDSDFRAWVKAGTVYQGRQVLLEADTTANHANRVFLAEHVVTNPDRHLELFVNVLACDPAIASLGTKVGTDISQNILLQKIDGVWNPLSNLIATTP